MIQLHRLEGFYWVARAGGYARAARAFPYPITQPAVHQQVKKLEGDLGVRLFERVGQERVQLTAAGQRLYRHVAPFLEGLPAIARSLKGGDYGGALSIHAPPLLMRHLLPAWLKRLSKHRPGVEVHLGEMPQLDLERLRRGDADLIVDHLPEVPSDLATLVVATLRAFVVLPADHPLADKKRTGLAHLQGETFVSYSPGQYAYDLQMKVLAQHGVAPRHTISAGSAETILGFVEAGLGFSLVPSLEAQGPSQRGIVAIPLSAPRVEFEVVAAWRKDTPENPLLDAVLETAPRP